MDVIARRSAAVETLLFFPSIAAFFMIVSRNPIMDNWHWPIGLIIVVSGTLLLLMIATLLLRFQCERARRKCLAHLRKKQLLLVKQGEKVDYLNLVIARIANDRRGGLSSAIENPVIAAILLPLSGLWSMDLLAKSILTGG